MTRLPDGGELKSALGSGCLSKHAIELARVPILVSSSYVFIAQISSLFHNIVEFALPSCITDFFLMYIN